MSKHVGMQKCPTCGRRPKRSTQANRHYWLLVHVIADKARPKDENGVARAYSADAWHINFRQTFLGATDYILPIALDPGKPALLQKTTITIPHSTADLSVDEFSDYVGRVEAWAAEQGIYLDELTT